MQPINPLNDTTSPYIVELIEAKLGAVNVLQAQIKCLIDELEIRQSPARPIQLELF